MKRFQTVILGAAAFLMLAAAGCDVDQPTHATLTTPATFGRYVAIGNSQTAGFMDAGLIAQGQAGSYPALIARQIASQLDTPPPFQQPFVAAPGIGSTDTGSPAVIAGVLYWNGSEITLLGTTPAADVPTLLLAKDLLQPYDNLGVPGATLWDVSHATSSATSQTGRNPYFDLILRNATAQTPTPFLGMTQLTEAVARRPALITLWIGNNDVLGGATSGNPVVGTNVTPPINFVAMYSALVAALQDSVEARTGAKPLIVAANIPSVTSVPYFIPKATFDAIAGGGHAVATVESDVTYVLLPALSYVLAGGHLPLPGNYTLTAAEVAAVENAINGYNDGIAGVCAAAGMPLVDIHALLRTVATTGVDGLHATHFLFNGHDATTTAFSLDGIHPNNRGQGLIANAFIDAINEAAGTSIPGVNVASLAWDPTYGRTSEAKAGAGPLITPEAAATMGAIFR
jgi:lysophospholipase L1-like esterase